MQELICQQGILIRIPRAEVTTVPSEMIWQGGRVSPAAQNLGVGQHRLCINLLRWVRACDLGLRSMSRRVKPEQARSDDRGGGNEKNPVHYLEVTPSLTRADQKLHILCEKGRRGQSLLLTLGQDELNKRPANDNDSSERELCLASNFHSSRNAVYVGANLRP